VFDSPFLLGFEHTRALIERAAKGAAESYPPYNVEQIAENRVRITLAVAGFSPDQLQVMVEDNQLIVAGKRDGDGKDDGQAAYLHRGIAARGFMRSFVLAQGMDVDLALLEHGLLHIDVVRRNRFFRPRRTNLKSRMASGSQTILTSVHALRNGGGR
jgi:HSP20 family molecular chaperone IbpA